MYAITGITGQVGGAMARALLAADQPVRAVVRDAGKGDAWASKGCEVAVANMDDADALAAAFKDAEGVFILPPSEFDPAPGFPEAMIRPAARCSTSADVGTSSTSIRPSFAMSFTPRAPFERYLRDLPIG